jgi:hypothetical protein
LHPSTLQKDRGPGELILTAEVDGIRPAEEGPGEMFQITVEAGGVMVDEGRIVVKEILK